MKSVWRGSSRATSSRLRLLDLDDHLGLAEHRVGVGQDRARPAPRSRRRRSPSPRPRRPGSTTSWPCSTSSRTPDGRERDAVLVGLDLGGDADLHGCASLVVVDELAAAQGEPEVDPVARRVQRPAGQLLDAPDPVAQRVAVAVELARGPLPLPVALDERLERAHQLAAVGALALLDRGEDGVAEQPQRVVVLEREQELEGAEVAVGREQRRAAPFAVGRERARLERAARLVERAPQVAGGDGAPRAARRAPSPASADARARTRSASANRSSSSLAARRAAAARRRSGRCRRPGRPAPRRAARAVSRPRSRLERARRVEHEHADALAQPERLEPPRQLGAGELAGRPSRSARRRPAGARCRRRRGGAAARARRP